MAMPFVDSSTDNLMRWDRSSAPFMEIWYATIHHRDTGWSFWFRYTITAPDERFGAPYCEVWAFAFDPEGKGSFAGKTRLPIDSLGAPMGRDHAAIVMIGDSWFAEDRLEGGVQQGDRRIEWSLSFEPATRSFHHLPPMVERRAEKMVSTLCSPNLSVPFSGVVKLDDRTFELRDDDGCQTHRWGRRHATTWAWGHCSTWDNGDQAVFEGLAARSPLGPIPGPTTTFTYLSLDGEDLEFNDLRWALRARSSYEMPTWAFTAHNEKWKVVGASRAGLDRFFQITYTDPDSTLRYCVNSEIADLAIEVYSRAGKTWRHHRSLTATRTAHLEFGHRNPFPELPISL